MQHVPDGRPVTYASLDLNAAKTAAFLLAHGVQMGDRVAVLCHNCSEFFELLFACGKIGAILVPLNWRMPAAELNPLLQDCQPTLLFYDTNTQDIAAALTVNARIPLRDQDHALATARQTLKPHAGRQVWPAGETWYLLYTSGTTGVPKAVIQTYGMALVNYINFGQAVDLRSTDTTLNFLPLFHTAGINLLAMPTLICGGTVYILPAFDGDKTLELLASGKLSTFFAVPAVYQQLSLHPQFDRVDLSAVRSWGCGGAPLPDRIAEVFLRKGIWVCNGYGMTETGPTVFLMDRQRVTEKVGSVGKPQLLSNVRIVGDNGKEVPTGEVGELWLSGPGITPGYWNRPQATEAAFADDGWLKTGDLACRDEDGYYYITGRSKEMYISGGENVYPAEVENMLCQHPAVLEAAVIAVVDEKWGEVGSAYILLRPDHTAPQDLELTAFCRDRLAAYKVPKEFHVVEDFPRSAAGKIQKHLIGGL